MKAKFYYWLLLFAFPFEQMLAQSSIEANGKRYWVNYAVGVEQCRSYIGNLRSQEKDSALNTSLWGYETDKRKVEIWLPKIDTVHICHENYRVRITSTESIATVLIHDKCGNANRCEYTTTLDSIKYKASWQWVNGKKDQNCCAADRCDCLRIVLVEIPRPVTILVRRETLLQRNDDGRYIER